MYRIIDEPLPSIWRRFAANPIFPLLASMLAGQWLAWPWFLLNGLALGSPFRRREALIVLGAFLGCVVWTGVTLAFDDGQTSKLVIRLMLLVLTCWKLACAYALHTLQGRTFELVIHYEGERRKLPPMVVLGVGFWVLRPLVLGNIDNLLLRLVLAGGI